MNGKSPDAFRTISEVAEWLGVNAHVLRFWESKFTQIKPVKRAGGRRYYRRSDMELLGGIRRLLHEDGMTIKGAQKVLRERGVRAVCALSKPVDDIAPADSAPVTEGTDRGVSTEASPHAATGDTARDATTASTEAQQRISEVEPVEEASFVSHLPEPSPSNDTQGPMPEPLPPVAPEQASADIKSPEMRLSTSETMLAEALGKLPQRHESAETLSTIHARLLALRERMDARV